MAESSLELLVAPPISSDKRRGRGIDEWQWQIWSIAEGGPKGTKKFLLDRFSVFSRADCSECVLGILFKFWHYIH